MNLAPGSARGYRLYMFSMLVIHQSSFQPTDPDPEADTGFQNVQRRSGGANQPDVDVNNAVTGIKQVQFCGPGFE